MFITVILFFSILCSLFSLALSAVKTIFNVNWINPTIYLILKMPGLILPNIVILFMLYLNIFVYQIKFEAIIAMSVYIIGIVLWGSIAIFIRTNFRFKNLLMDIVCLGTPFLSIMTLWIIGIIRDR